MINRTTADVRPTSYEIRTIQQGGDGDLTITCSPRDDHAQKPEIQLQRNDLTQEEHDQASACWAMLERAIERTVKRRASRASEDGAQATLAVAIQDAKRITRVAQEAADLAEAMKAAAEAEAARLSLENAKAAAKLAELERAIAEKAPAEAPPETAPE